MHVRWWWWWYCRWRRMLLWTDSESDCSDSATTCKQHLYRIHCLWSLLWSLGDWLIEVRTIESQVLFTQLLRQDNIILVVDQLMFAWGTRSGGCPLFATAGELWFKPHTCGSFGECWSLWASHLLTYYLQWRRMSIASVMQDNNNNMQKRPLFRCAIFLGSFKYYYCLICNRYTRSVTFIKEWIIM